MATPHIAAEPGDFAPAVLMPGDPKRARRIAELLMDDARLVTDVRGMLGFTGTVNGRPLSVMGSGMGQPSFTIYATELFSQFGVERIIRVGTAGALSPKVKVGDVIVATGAHTDKQALAILTVSDHLLDHSGDMSAAERETRFADSLRLAVAAAHS